MPCSPAPRTAARVCALVCALVLLTLGLAACGGDDAPAATDTPVESPSPTEPATVDVAAAESVWGSLVAQIGGKHVTVTSIMDSTVADTSAFAPSAEQKTQIAQAQLVVVTGAGYDAWALEQVDRAAAVVVSAASAIGAGTGDNPYLWYSRDVRQAVAESVSDALTKLLPKYADDFAANLKAWQAAEEKLERKIDALGERLGSGTAYVAYTPVGYYLFSELGARDATPTEYTSLVLKGQVPDAAARTAFSDALSDLPEGLGFTVSDAQHPVDGMNAVSARADALGLPQVELPELPGSDEGTVSEWLTQVIEGVADSLKPLVAASSVSPTPSPSPSGDGSPSASPTGSAVSPVPSSPGASASE